MNPIHDDFNLTNAVRNIVSNAISTYLDSRGEPTTQHAIVDRLFPIERRISSIIGGLQTSLGTTVWQSLAIHIATANRFTIKNARSFQKPVSIPSSIVEFINMWRQNRERRSVEFRFNDFIDELRIACQNVDREQLTFTNLTSGDGIDIWLEKDAKEYIFDVKTVQINSGSGNDFSRKVMEWCAYRLLREPHANISVAMAFPYSPFPPYTVESWWSAQGSRAYPLVRGEDALVQDEFWSLLSGQPDTWTHIINAIDSLKDDGYSDRYRSLFYPTNE